MKVIEYVIPEKTRVIIPTPFKIHHKRIFNDLESAIDTDRILSELVTWLKQRNIAVEQLKITVKSKGQDGKFLYLRDLLVSLDQGNYSQNEQVEIINIQEFNGLLFAIYWNSSTPADAFVESVEQIFNGKKINLTEENAFSCPELPKPLKPYFSGSNLPLPAVAGGNLVSVLSKDKSSQLLIIGQEPIVRRAFLNKALFNKSVYLAFEEDFIKNVRSHLKLSPSDKIIPFKQIAYHVDLLVVSPKPGVVILNSYQLFIDDLNKLELFIKLVLSVTEKHIGKISAADLKLQQDYMKHREDYLNKLEKQLKDLGFEVIRVFGAGGLIGVYGDTRLIIDYLHPFNFINGIPVQIGQEYYFLTLAALPEFAYYQEKFREELEKQGVKVVFLNSTASEVVKNYILTQVTGSGLRCLTLLAPVAAAMGSGDTVAGQAGAAVSSTNLERPCVICGKATSQRCSRCRSSYYCSVNCQRADWSLHQPNCKKA